MPATFARIYRKFMYMTQHSESIFYGQSARVAMITHAAGHEGKNKNIKNGILL
jgi:hypothetical protein